MRIGPYVKILLILVVLLAGTSLFFIYGVDSSPVKPYDQIQKAPAEPICTPAQVALETKAIPLQTQQNAVNQQLNDLNVQYLGDITNNWVDTSGAKQTYEQQQATLMQQWLTLQQQITALIGNVYCR